MEQQEIDLKKIADLINKVVYDPGNKIISEQALLLAGAARLLEQAAEVAA